MLLLKFSKTIRRISVRRRREKRKEKKDRKGVDVNRTTLPRWES